MKTSPITPEMLASSVIAVPPLARDAELKVCATENAKVICHLEDGGVRTLLYGGNAVFYHITLAEYAWTLPGATVEAMESLAGFILGDDTEQPDRVVS